MILIRPATGAWPPPSYSCFVSVSADDCPLSRVAIEFRLVYASSGLMRYWRCGSAWCKRRIVHTIGAVRIVTGEVPGLVTGSKIGVERKSSDGSRFVVALIARRCIAAEC